MVVNVTPAAPQTFPFLETWNGQVYQIASLSGLGCADTVYSTTASTVNGTTTYTPYVVLPANQGLQVIEAYETQFALPNMACSSYIQQADLLTGVSTSTTTSNMVLGFDINTSAGLFYAVLFGLVLVAMGAIGIWIIVKIADSVHGKRR